MLVAVFAVGFATMHDLGHSTRTVRFSEFSQEMKNIVEASIACGWHNRSVRLLMAVSFVQSGFITWGFYAWQPYFLELLGRDAIWVAGAIAALISLSMIAGNTLVYFFSKFCGRRTTLLLWAAGVQTAAAVGVGIVDSFSLAVALFLLVSATMGVTGPVKQAYLHQLIPSQQRATVISFDSMMGSAGGVLGQTGLGYLSRAQSIGLGYVIGGLTTLATLPVLFLLRGLRDPADKFVGNKAGMRGTCAAQGIPAISQVEAMPVEGAKSGA